MIIRWGRNRAVAGALVATFITPVVAPVTTSIHETKIRPSNRLEYRHITPVAVAPALHGIHRAHIRPDIRFEYRHITPSDIQAPESEIKNGVYRGKPDRDRILQDDEELIELITMMVSFDVIG